MKTYLIELVADKKGMPVWTCAQYGGSTKQAAINKAIKESKQAGATNQRDIKAFESVNCAQMMPF